MNRNNESKLDRMMRVEPRLYDLLTCNGFMYEETGGGCDCFYTCIGDRTSDHFEVWITDGDAGAPESMRDPIVIGFYKVLDCGCISEPEDYRDAHTIEEAEAIVAEYFAIAEGHSDNPRENGH